MLLNLSCQPSLALPAESTTFISPRSLSSVPIYTRYYQLLLSFLLQVHSWTEGKGKCQADEMDSYIISAYWAFYFSMCLFFLYFIISFHECNTPSSFANVIQWLSRFKNDLCILSSFYFNQKFSHYQPKFSFHKSTSLLTNLCGVCYCYQRNQLQ